MKLAALTHQLLQLAVKKIRSMINAANGITPFSSVLVHEVLLQL